MLLNNTAIKSEEETPLYFAAYTKEALQRTKPHCDLSKLYGICPDTILYLFLVMYPCWLLSPVTDVTMLPKSWYARTPAPSINV